MSKTWRVLDFSGFAGYSPSGQKKLEIDLAKNGLGCAYLDSFLKV